MKLNLNDLIPNSKYFKWKEALYLPSYKVYHEPSDAEIANIIALASKLNKVRELLAKPILVSCWIRPTSVICDDVKFKGKNYNAEVDGAPASAHIVGSAIDFKVSGMSVDDALKIIKPQVTTLELSAENNGSSNGRNWIHLDNRQRKGKWVVFNP